MILKKDIFCGRIKCVIMLKAGIFLSEVIMTLLMLAGISFQEWNLKPITPIAKSIN
jgi:hypothetical protein